jgi:hypothetical protein
VVLKPLFLTGGQEPHFAGMVHDHEARHRAYCKLHGYEYRAEPFQDLTDSWFRFELIHDIMRSGEYSHIFWIDADALVVDHSRDMRDTLPEWAHLALTMHPSSSQLDVVHFQTGVMYWRCCEQSLALLDRCLEAANLNGRDKVNDQAVLNYLLHVECDWQSGLRILTFPWNNSVHNQPRGREIVAAWHGAAPPAERRAWMQAYAEQHPFEEISR